MADTVTVSTTAQTVTIAAAGGTTVTASNPAEQTININDSSLQGFTSDALGEGVTNRYFTVARSRDSYRGHIPGALPNSETYFVEPSSPNTRNIIAIFVKCSAGSGTAVFKNGSNTILSRPITTSGSTTTGISLSNTVLAPDGELTIETAVPSSCDDFRYSIEYTE